MTGREDDCVTGYHAHVKRCQRAGYANGRTDALDEVEEAIQRLVDEIDGVSSAGHYRTGLKHALVKVKDAR